MSYGFMVWQLPTNIMAASRRSDRPKDFRDIEWNGDGMGILNGCIFSKLKIMGEEWIVRIPDVWVLGTRSGCDKTNLDPRKDIIRMGLVNGNVICETPEMLNRSHFRPSYDTLVILAHAVGNVVVASIFLALDRYAYFPEVLSKEGLSITHWHNYLGKGEAPVGYASHGRNNPPVSCSTPQSAVYAFTGKIAAFEEAILRNEEYCGDVHVEPHHGTNIVGTMSLEETALWVDKCTFKRRGQ